MGQIHGLDRKDEKAGEDALKKPEFCSKLCGIVNCDKRKQNGWDFCDACPDYPCEDVMEKENRYTSKYPLCESPIENLKYIREHGMEEFLELERKQFDPKLRCKYTIETACDILEAVIAEYEKNKETV